MNAYWKEWKNLESQQVWKWEECEEWEYVSKAAIFQGQIAHLGFLFGIMVEKGSEYDEDDPRRYWKYRVVFRGNDVKDQKWDVAMFQEMATTPTTLEASRYSDLLACSPGTLSRVGTSNRLTFKQIWRHTDVHRSSKRIMDSGNAHNEMPGLQTEKGIVWTQESGCLLAGLLQQAMFGCGVQTYIR